MNNALFGIEEIDKEISYGKLSGPDLNVYSSRIASLSDDLKRKRRLAAQVDREKLGLISERLATLKKAISELTTQAKEQAVDTVQKQIKAAKERTADEVRAEASQKTVSELAKSAGPQSIDETLSWIDFLDREIRALVEPADYQNLVESFSDLLEGALK